MTSEHLLASNSTANAWCANACDEAPRSRRPRVIAVTFINGPRSTRRTRDGARGVAREARRRAAAARLLDRLGDCARFLQPAKILRSVVPVVQRPRTPPFQECYRPARAASAVSRSFPGQGASSEAVATVATNRLRSTNVPVVQWPSTSAFQAEAHGFESRRGRQPSRSIPLVAASAITAARLYSRPREAISPHLRRRGRWDRNDLIEGNSSSTAPPWLVA